MKRLAAFVVAGGLAAAPALAQYPRIVTHPTVPSTEALDRLSLRLGWRTAVPVEGYRDGIATIQHLGDLVVVQTRRGAVTALDPNTGAARWHTAVGLPYPVTHQVGYNEVLLLVANGPRVFALDRATGGVLWNVDLPGSPSSPPAADAEAFYVCLANGRLSAYAFPIATPAAPPAGTSPGAGVAGRPQEPAAPLSSGPGWAGSPAPRAK